MAGTGRSSHAVSTPLGTLIVEVGEAGITRIELPGASSHEAATDGVHVPPVACDALRQLEEYAGGERRGFDLEIDWSVVGSSRRIVLETLVGLAPYGSTVTYGELATASGVGDAQKIGVHMNRNPFPIVVPCHRVVAADGLGGYGGGVALKRRLLELEGALPPSLDLGDV